MPSYNSVHVSNVVSVGLTSTVVLDANPSRYRAIFTNPDAANPVWLQLSTDELPPTAVVGQGIRIDADSPPFVLEDYQGHIAGIATGAPVSLGVVEI